MRLELVLLDLKSTFDREESALLDVMNKQTEVSLCTVPEIMFNPDKLFMFHVRSNPQKIH